MPIDIYGLCKHANPTITRLTTRQCVGGVGGVGRFEGLENAKKWVENLRVALRWRRVCKAQTAICIYS